MDMEYWKIESRKNCCRKWRRERSNFFLPLQVYQATMCYDKLYEYISIYADWKILKVIENIHFHCEVYIFDPFLCAIKP